MKTKLPKHNSLRANKSLLSARLGMIGLLLVIALPISLPISLPRAQATANLSNESGRTGMSGFTCPDLQKASQRLSAHTENIANRTTTRTDVGGPYRRIELKCHELYCESQRRQDFNLVYQPAHPDANQSGYVQFPKIDVTAEFAALNSAATEVRLLAGKELCGAKSLSSATSALIKYASGTAIQTDTFNFTTDGRLTSWSRILRDGTAQHFSFNSDGSISKQ